jgi:hypothetical protein
MRAGAFHPRLDDPAQAGHPPQQVPVALHGGRERLGPQQTTDTVQHRGHILLQVRVHATRHRARSTYH